MSVMKEGETPREKFLWSQEILTTLEWVDVLQDYEATMEAIALFDKHISVVLEGSSRKGDIFHIFTPPTDLRTVHERNFPSPTIGLI